MTIVKELRASLIFRVTAAYVCLLSVLCVSLGTYLYHSASATQQSRTTTVIENRIDYYARLVREVFTIKELRERPLLIANMLSAEGDILVFQRLSGEIVVNVNLGGMQLPAEILENPGEGEARFLRNAAGDGRDIVWAWQRTATISGPELLVIAGHPTRDEAAMISSYGRSILIGSLLGVAITCLLSYILLKRGLAPVSEMASRAAEISPAKLGLRLDIEPVPQELRSLAVSVNAMLDRLEAGYARLTRFSSDLGHEIRTPLGILIGQTQVTLSQPRTVEEYCQILGSNLEEFESLRRLSENMLFLARADDDRIQMTLETIEMGAELEKLADYFEGMASERGMTFDVTAAASANANRDLLRRAVGNLVLNAIVHGEADTVISLSAAPVNDTIVINVENRIGLLPENHFENVFDRFYQADPSRSASSSSNGLGLSIVQAIMTLHDGHADVIRLSPDTVRFRLVFPLRSRQN